MAICLYCQKIWFKHLPAEERKSRFSHFETIPIFSVQVDPWLLCVCVLGWDSPTIGMGYCCFKGNVGSQPIVRSCARYLWGTKGCRRRKLRRHICASGFPAPNRTPTCCYTTMSTSATDCINLYWLHISARLLLNHLAEQRCENKTWGGELAEDADSGKETEFVCARWTSRSENNCENNCGRKRESEVPMTCASYRIEGTGKGGNLHLGLAR